MKRRGGVWPGPLGPMMGSMVSQAGGAVPWYLPEGIVAGDVVAAYDFAAAPDMASALVNLANPGTYNLTALDPAPSWNATDGVVMSGHTYLRVPIQPVTNQTWSMLVWLADGPSGSIWNTFAGTHGSVVARSFAILRNTTTIRFYNGNGLNVTSSVTGGTFAIGGNRAYIDGADVGGIGAPTVETQPTEMYLGAARFINYASPINHCVCKLKGFAVWDTALSGAQMAAVHTALLANDANWWAADGASGAQVAYRFVGAANKAAAYTNLVNPGTLDIVEPVRTLVHIPDDGLVADDAGMHALETGLTPTADGTWTLTGHFTRGAGATDVPIVAVAHVGSGFDGFGLRWSGTFAVFSNGGNRLVNWVSPASGTGGVAGRRGWNNGIKDSADIPLSPQAVGKLPVLAARYNPNDRVTASGINQTLHRLAIYNKTLSDVQMQALHAAMLAQ